MAREDTMKYKNTTTFNPVFSKNALRQPCLPDCPDRAAKCAATCEKWLRYVEERNKRYKDRLKGVK